MKVWITKYVLTKGILEKECNDFCLKTDSTGNMICIKEGAFPQYFHGEGKEWHRTKESAIKKAEEMRHGKIASLKKKIEKLEKMKFE